MLLETCSFSLVVISIYIIRQKNRCGFVKHIWFKFVWWNNLQSKIKLLKIYRLQVQIWFRFRYIKKVRMILWHRYIPVNFAKFLRTSFLQNTSVWLLLALGVKKVKRAIFILKIYQVRLEQVNLLVYWPYWLCFNQKQKNNISYKILANWLFLDLLLSAFFF